MSEEIEFILKTIMETGEKKKRPKWVWAITIFYFFSAGWTLLSFYLIGSGLIPMGPAAKAYFDSLSTFDYILTVLLGLAGFFGAITLFLLRKIAFYLFAGALIANPVLTIWHALSKGWIAAVGYAGLVGAVLGWALLIAVCVYSWKLTKKGVLT